MENGEAIPSFDSKFSYFFFLFQIILKYESLGPEKVFSTKKLQKQTNAFIQSKLEAPSIAMLKQWVLEENPDIKWKAVKKTIQRFRNSLPIVSRNTPDGRATSARSHHLPQVFRSPAWVAADLGDSFFSFSFLIIINDFQASCD